MDKTFFLRAPASADPDQPDRFDSFGLSFEPLLRNARREVSLTTATATTPAAFLTPAPDSGYYNQLQPNPLLPAAAQPSKPMQHSFHAAHLAAFNAFRGNSFSAGLGTGMQQTRAQTHPPAHMGGANDPAIHSIPTLKSTRTASASSATSAGSPPSASSPTSLESRLASGATAMTATATPVAPMHTGMTPPALSLVTGPLVPSAASVGGLSVPATLSDLLLMGHAAPAGVQLIPGASIIPSALAGTGPSPAWGFDSHGAPELSSTEQLLQAHSATVAPAPGLGAGPAVPAASGGLAAAQRQLHSGMYVLPGIESSAPALSAITIPSSSASVSLHAQPPQRGRGQNRQQKNPPHQGQKHKASSSSNSSSSASTSSRNRQRPTAQPAAAATMGSVAAPAAPPAANELRILFNKDFAGLLIKNAKAIGQKSNASVWVDADNGFVTIRGAGMERAEIAVRNLLLQASFPRRVSFESPPTLRLMDKVHFVPASIDGETGEIDVDSLSGKVDCYLELLSSPPSSSLVSPSGAMQAHALTLGSMPGFPGRSDQRSIALASAECGLPVAELRTHINELVRLGHIQVDELLSFQMRLGFLRYRVPQDFVGRVFSVADVKDILERDRQIDIHMDYRLPASKFQRLMSLLKDFGGAAPGKVVHDQGIFIKLFVNHKFKSPHKQCHVNFEVEPATLSERRPKLNLIQAVPGENVARTLLQTFHVPMGDRLGVCVEVKGKTPGQLHAQKTGRDRQLTQYESSLELFKTSIAVDRDLKPVLPLDAQFAVSAQRVKVADSFTDPQTGIQFSLSRIRQFRSGVEESGRLEISGCCCLPEEAQRQWNNSAHKQFGAENTAAAASALFRGMEECIRTSCEVLRCSEDLS